MVRERGLRPARDRRRDGRAGGPARVLPRLRGRRERAGGALAAKLAELAPLPRARVFFSSSGSEANDTQLKLIWQYQHLRGKPEKRKVIARRRGYHGSTVASASLTGLPYVHAGFGLPLPGFLHVSPAHWPSDARAGESEDRVRRAARARARGDARARRAGDRRRLLRRARDGRRRGAVPPETYFAEVQTVLRRHDVLLVADEVICGFGRLGAGSARSGSASRRISCTVAKGLTSGYAPLSACLVSRADRRRLARGARELGAFNHGYTYSGHPVAAAAALANLAIFERERLVERADRIGALLQRRLRETCAPASEAPRRARHRDDCGGRAARPRRREAPAGPARSPTACSRARSAERWRCRHRWCSTKRRSRSSLGALARALDKLA